MVSIIIPTYNRVVFLAETLNSIINQSFSNWECIVIDDGSDDDTDELMNKITSRDSRIKYCKRPNSYKKGPAGCRNFGFSLSQGEFINWFDSDDIMLSDKLESDLKEINSGNYDFTISQTQFFDSVSNVNMGYWNDRVFSSDPLNDFIMLKIGWSTNAPLWRKSALVQNNLTFNEELFGPDDFDYHIKALIYNLRPTSSNKIKVFNRVHPDRIENHHYKAKSKSIIVFYLLKNRDLIGLSQECIDHQIAFAIYVLKSMYKHKKISDGLLFSSQLLKLSNLRLNRTKIFNLFMRGLFYYVSGKGYNLISKV